MFALWIKGSLSRLSDSYRWEADRGRRGCSGRQTLASGIQISCCTREPRDKYNIEVHPKINECFGSRSVSFQCKDRIRIVKMASTSMLCVERWRLHSSPPPPPHPHPLTHHPLPFSLSEMTENERGRAGGGCLMPSKYFSI